MESHKESILPMFIVDAFTKQAFSGNGAAVCLLRYQQVVPDDVKQKIAAEMNLSETAFVSITERGDTFERGKRFGLQWFTPTCEVSLCGHATLASSAVLFSVCDNPSPCLEFETASGVLRAQRTSGGEIEIDLPAYPSGPVDLGRYEDVVKEAVGTLPTEEVVLSDSRKLLIRLRDGVTRHRLQALSPRAEALLSADPDLRGVIVTLRGSDCADADGERYDFVSRYFAPWLGIPEDPVTGSAHSVLAPFWSRILRKDRLYARQCSRRGGDLRLRLTGGDRVAIAGHAVVVLEGHVHF